MPRDESEPEIVTPTQRVTDLEDPLREHNALLARYGPVMEQMVKLLAQGATPGKLGLVDYLGQGLMGGKFDGLLGEVAQSVRRGTRGLPRRKR